MQWRGGSLRPKPPPPPPSGKLIPSAVRDRPWSGEGSSQHLARLSSRWPGTLEREPQHPALSPQALGPWPQSRSLQQLDSPWWLPPCMPSTAQSWGWKGPPRHDYFGPLACSPRQTPPTRGHEQLAELRASHLALLKVEFFLIKAALERRRSSGLGCRGRGAPPRGLRAAARSLRFVLPSKWVRRRPRQAALRSWSRLLSHHPQQVPQICFPSRRERWGSGVGRQGRRPQEETPTREQGAFWFFPAPSLTAGP